MDKEKDELLQVLDFERDSNDCVECAKQIIAKVRKHRLDRPKLREKIYKIFDTYDSNSPISRGRVIREILALNIPKDKPPLLTMNLELSSHQKYLMKAQREADIKWYKGD